MVKAKSVMKGMHGWVSGELWRCWRCKPKPKMLSGCQLKGRERPGLQSKSPCYRLFLTTFPWPQWKTSRGQGKMWRRFHKDLGKDSCGAEKIRLHLRWATYWRGLLWWNYNVLKMDYKMHTMRTYGVYVLIVLFHAGYINVDNTVKDIV